MLITVNLDKANCETILEFYHSKKKKTKHINLENLNVELNKTSVHFKIADVNRCLAEIECKLIETQKIDKF